MPLASLPGPPSGQWHLGLVAVHGYALCAVLGVVAVVTLAERRYRASGGRRWLIVDLATIAVPAGLVGARLYRILTSYQRYFGHGRDWVDILRIWDGGLGLPGLAIGALVATWIWCRRGGTAIEPVLVAAVPGLALGQAIGVLGNWFAQSLYGPPSGLPWAVEIAPRSRVPGYQNFGTFQPLFLYESIWDLALAIALVHLVRTRHLTGGQTLAAFAALYALGRLVTASFLLAAPSRHPGVPAEQVAAAAVIIAAAGYLFAAGPGRGPDALVAAARRLRLPVPRSVTRSPGPVRQPQAAQAGQGGVQAGARPADAPGAGNADALGAGNADLPGASTSPAAP